MDENMEAMVNQVTEAVTEQVMSEPEVTNAVTEQVVQQAAQNTGVNPWVTIGVGGVGIGAGILIKMGWDKWIGPKLAERRMERKFMKEARKAAREAMKEAKAKRAQAAQQAATPAPEAPQPNAETPVEPTK